MLIALSCLPHSSPRSAALAAGDLNCRQSRFWAHVVCVQCNGADKSQSWVFLMHSAVNGCYKEGSLEKESRALCCRVHPRYLKRLFALRISRLDVEEYYFVAISWNMTIIITNQLCFINNKVFSCKRSQFTLPQLSYHRSFSQLVKLPLLTQQLISRAMRQAVHSVSRLLVSAGKNHCERVCHGWKLPILCRKRLWVTVAFTCAGISPWVISSP